MSRYVEQQLRESTRFRARKALITIPQSLEYLQMKSVVLGLVVLAIISMAASSARE